jgi:hypothetical protein
MKPVMRQYSPFRLPTRGRLHDPRGDDGRAARRQADDRRGHHLAFEIVAMFRHVRRGVRVRAHRERERREQRPNAEQIRGKKAEEAKHVLEVATSNAAQYIRTDWR